jgi:hypothetical protein
MLDGDLDEIPGEWPKAYRLLRWEGLITKEKALTPKGKSHIQRHGYMVYPQG